MGRARRFSNEFKRAVVEELLSGTFKRSAICRRYNISSGLLAHWKKRYIRGAYDNEPTEEGEMQIKMEQLERMVGRLTMENNLLKKALKLSLRSQKRRESLLPTTFQEISDMDAKS